MNSILQCMANIEYKPGKGRIGTKLNPILDSLRDATNEGIVNPSNLVPSLPNKFHNRMQHDAHELLSLMLDELEKEIVYTDYLDELV